MTLEIPVQALIHDLEENLEGDVRFDAISKQIYSVDASIFEIQPIGVVLPKTEKDVITTVKIAAKHNIPITARGAGTGLTGGCIGKALIVDTSKYLSNILEINYDEEFAVCEPGVVQDQLNLALAAKGYRLGPDTSTGNRATIGGMIGNNSAGAHSLRYGKMVDHVEAVGLVLSNGDLINFEEIDEETWANKCQEKGREGEIYSQIRDTIKEYRQDILDNYPKIPRRVSGYNLDELVDRKSINLAKLITGSEGTLGIATKIRVKISKKPQCTALCALHFTDIVAALDLVPSLLEYDPYALEVIDGEVIKMGCVSPSMRGRLEWLSGEPDGLLVMEFDGNSKEELEKNISRFESWASHNNVGYKRSFLRTTAEQSHVWALRKAGLGLLMSRRTYSRAIAFIEDLAVAPEKIGAFIHKLREYLKEKGMSAGMYGHAGPGLVHVRPYVNLREPQEFDNMITMMKEVADMALDFGGALSGEHGDGLLRSWLNERMFGKRVIEAFIQVKQAFDPDKRMNPGKIIAHSPPSATNLRTNPALEPINIPTFLDFSQEGGFELAVDMCNGNAQCRKHNDLMCPSFHAHHDERHSTRARAQSLRSIVNGRVPKEAFTSHELHDVLDYCLECKGCKTECPSQVDMAKMKSEFLYQYQEKHGYSFRTSLFGNIGIVNQLGSLLPSLANFISGTRISKKMMALIGIAPERSLPAFSHERFSSWLSKQKEQAKSDKSVFLFVDTFTEFNCPEIGQAAYKLLTTLGYYVITQPWQCCGRPMLSKGMLKQAKVKAQNLIQSLHDHASKGIPIIGLEPSCILTIKDDLYSLVPESNALEVSKACITIDEFLAKLIEKGEFKLPFNKKELHIQVHTHCHQKSLVGSAPTLKVLRAVENFTVNEIDSGCCGLAGSFGYEKEHYKFSMKIGEDRLFPAIRKKNESTQVMANGMSCRSQISHGTQRKAKHLVEILFDAIN
ncbi:MAG: FAD/FMN-containing dehydrogenase/Fe-S oxidoreductase [Chlamydiales bacterium]